MKIPLRPPKFEDLMNELVSDSPERLLHLLSLHVPPDPSGKYYHWDKLRHLKNMPDDLSNREWWLAIKMARKVMYKPVPHKDKYGKSFVYAEPDVVRRLLHEIDIHGGGELRSSEQVNNPQIRESYLINSLIEEAITSSQLEGASTTRKVAKEMLRQNRRPRDKSEKMIVNNYNAMQFVNDISDESLTPGHVLELHKIVTEGTFDDEDAAAGRLRTTDDIIVGDDRDATVIHEPPKALELESRLESICDFANDDNVLEFLHPVIRAILLHFMLAYDHPFEDGNGRTARALFYWSMRKQGYWTMEYISISRILKKAPAQYTRAYLYTETDDNDITYFLMHQLGVIVKAIQDLFEYIKKKSNEIKSVEKILSRSPDLQRLLNHRQVSVINRVLKKPDSVFYIESHRGSHNVTYDTARTDLLKLVDIGLLEKTRIGKAFAFVGVSNLNEKMQKLNK